MNSNKKKAGILSAIALSFIVASGCSVGNTIPLDNSSSSEQSDIPSASVSTAAQSTPESVTKAESTKETVQTDLSSVTEKTEKPVKSEWTESKASGEKYVTVSCYSRQKAVLGAQTVKLYNVNDKVKIVATTDTGYSKLEDGTFIHNDYLSDSKVSVTVATTTEKPATTPTATDKPATQKPATTTVKPENTPSTAEYEWVVKPSYEYDDVVMLGNASKFIDMCIPTGYAYLSNYTYKDGKIIHDFGDITGSELEGLFIAEINGKKALIDYNKNVYTDFIFDDIFTNPVRTLEFRIYGEENEYGYRDYDGYTLNSDFELCCAVQGFGSEPCANYYDIIKKVAYSVCFDDLWVLDDDYSGMCMVQGAIYEGSLESYDWDKMYTDRKGTGKYGIFSDGKLVVPVEYDGGSDVSVITDREYNEEEFYRQERAILHKNNKVYVFDKNGKCYSNGVYDYTEQPYKHNLVYANGYLTVCKNGKWGLIDINGKEAVKCQFEDITSVYNGKAWAKQNGKWGVIKLA